MHAYQENLRLAQEICQVVKQQVVCSNDIIPRTQLPWLTPAMVPSAINRFELHKVRAYLHYTQYTNEVRNLVVAESREKGISCEISSSAIAIAKLGVGESQELVTFALSKLIALGRRDIAFVAIVGRVNNLKEHKAPHVHTFLLLGIEEGFALKNGDISQLNRLSENVVVLDLLLNYVGRARDYIKDQTQYLMIFGHNQICAVDVVSQIHIDNHSIIEENVKQLLEFVESKGVLKFDRAFCDLPLERNLSSQKESFDYETTLLKGLNTNTGLSFSGVRDERCHVDAVAQIRSEDDNVKAKRVQSRLGAGCFYTGSSQRFFVIQDINVTASKEQNLPRRIFEAYC